MIFPGICGRFLCWGGFLTPCRDVVKIFQHVLFFHGNDFSGILGIGPFNNVCYVKIWDFLVQVKNLGACSVVY